MSERIHVLAQQLLNQPTVAACSLQSVRELAERYPYFAPAQFLLLEKLRETDDPGYAEQLQKAVLYYHNPLEFEYFISSDQFLTHLYLEPTPETAQPEKTESAQAAPLPDITKADHTESETETQLPEVDAEPETEKPIGNFQIKGLTVSTPSTPPLSFEPYHTVDYFASQGIKLSDREVGQDKFGKQLKSFTEWLKTMKRLPQQAAAQTIDASTEKNVQHLAADSVHEAEVVTEAMAEVWLKQGNNARAAEVYRKLSLLNPSKKAYFAAKIDHLKSST